MSAVEAPRTHTPEDLLSRSGMEHFELVDGRLVEKKTGMRSSVIAGLIQSYLIAWNRAEGIGWVPGPDCGYQCFPGDPKRVRKPDVSFIRKDRLPGGKLPEGHTPVAPDLAVEVVSPNDLAYELEEKLFEYVAAGVPLIWIVYPNSRTIDVIEHGRRAGWVTVGEELTGSDVLPGFRCPVAELFPDD